MLSDSGTSSGSTMSVELPDIFSSQDVFFGRIKEATKSRSDDSFDDSSSTCAPSSVESLSVDSTLTTPDLGPVDNFNICNIPEAPLNPLASLGLPLKKNNREVCLIHHDEMQLHAPPHTKLIFELPRRIVAIENCLKGFGFCSSFGKQSCGSGDMAFLRAGAGKRTDLFVGFGRPEAKKRRLEQSSRHSAAHSVWDSCTTVEAPLVKHSDLRLVHSKQHIDKVKEFCDLATKRDSSFFALDIPYERQEDIPEGVFDEGSDVYYSPHSLAAMQRAAGGSVEAVRQLFNIDESSGRATSRSSKESSFAIVRPPGHHCCSEPSGFCFFSNTAIAAAHARRVLGLKRVAIVDWDYHHGDGQQKLFYRDPTVLTISLHVALVPTDAGEEVVFPCFKGMDIISNGHGKGKGYNINIPWPHPYVTASNYLEAFRTIVIPALQGFDPELVLVACGFDAVEGDNLAGTRLVPNAYYHMTRELMSLQKPIAVVLEGGYSPKLLAQGSLNVMHALLGWEAPCVYSGPPLDIEIEEEDAQEVDNILDAVRRQLNTLPPWNGMRRLGSEKYFHEEPSPKAELSIAAARKLNKLIKEKAIVKK